MSKIEVRDELFRRHGQITDEGLRAPCAGCGTPLSKHRATLDRYPVPGAAGGTYHIDNCRLACQRCNTRWGSHGYRGSVLAGMSEWQKTVFRRNQRRGLKPVITPEEIFGENWVRGEGMPPTTTGGVVSPEPKRYRSRCECRGLSQIDPNPDCPLHGIDSRPKCSVHSLDSNPSKTGSTQGSKTVRDPSNSCICPVDFREPWHHLRDCSKWSAARNWTGKHAAMLTPGFPLSRNAGDYVGKHRRDPI